MANFVDISWNISSYASSGHAVWRYETSTGVVPETPIHHSARYDTNFTDTVTDDMFDKEYTYVIAPYYRTSDGVYYYGPSAEVNIYIEQTSSGVE